MLTSLRVSDQVRDGVRERAGEGEVAVLFMMECVGIHCHFCFNLFVRSKCLSLILLKGRRIKCHLLFFFFFFSLTILFKAPLEGSSIKEFVDLFGNRCASLFFCCFPVSVPVFH